MKILEAFLLTSLGSLLAIVLPPHLVGPSVFMVAALSGVSLGIWLLATPLPLKDFSKDSCLAGGGGHPAMAGG